ncbi:MAG: hypothetical protein HY929_02620 [Euryarchaeota archaeon]|nr:hypothetical protein [Euryarchaeota archaeon]
MLKRETIGRAIPVIIVMILFLIAGCVSSPPVTEGEALYKEKCSRCHELRSPLRHTASEWPATVDRMQSKDPVWISDKEKEKILKYLQANARK